MGKVPSGTIAFLFTDLEGSTRLWDEHRVAMERAVEDHDRILRAADSGLPDLLIPPAALAFSRGDTERCRHLITAVRRSPVPTQNFMHTVIYRQLRDRVGLAEENPLDHQPIEQVFQDAREWMDTLDPADDPNHSTQPPTAR